MPLGQTRPTSWRLIETLKSKIQCLCLPGSTGRPRSKRQRAAPRCGEQHRRPLLHPGHLGRSVGTLAAPRALRPLVSLLLWEGGPRDPARLLGL